MQLSKEEFRKLYEVAGNDFHDRPNFEALKELAQLRRQFEESQRKQEIKDREQEKENKKNQFYSASALVVGVLTLAATIIFGILQVTH
jgi:hypothetical protein